MTKKLLRVVRVVEGVEKKINLVFTKQERDGRTVWCCDIEDETATNLETLMWIAPA